jgi:hypothetical protein
MNKFARIWHALLRVFSETLKHGESKADGASACVSGSSQLFVGAYTTGEAKRLLDRFTSEGVRFDIKCDVSGPTESDDGSYVDQPRINIFVDNADAQRATQLITQEITKGNDEEPSRI